MTSISIDQIKSSSNLNLLTASNFSNFTSKLETAVKFFDSNEWLQMKNTNLDLAHKYAITFLSSVMGNKNFAIYDNGKALYDASGIIAKLSPENLSLLESIDCSKTPGLISKDQIIFQYIGSTVAYVGSFTYGNVSFSSSGGNTQSSITIYENETNIPIATFSYTVQNYGYGPVVFTVTYLKTGIILAGTYSAVTNYLMSTEIVFTTVLGGTAEWYGNRITITFSTNATVTAGETYSATYDLVNPTV